MENTNHTQGPWEMVKTANARLNDTDSFHVFSQPDKNEMYQTVCFTESEANAKLIAAAPDLLHALEQIRGIEAWIQDDKMKSLFQRLVYSAVEKARI
jgi:hypothetical protein